MIFLCGAESGRAGSYWMMRRPWWATLFLRAACSGFWLGIVVGCSRRRCLLTCSPAGLGRPSLAGEVAASVLVLQALGDLPGRDAVAAVRCDIRWL